ncbi:hypothetical protein CI109_103453 [Kwoniella shandongensis]|uniref:Uncharacterized protein n=1 Tax=Kwoniella shandongensis TaxID=1734106 RepID=A0A5M6BW58_9TREE|nr:uncharacterized protein CI109_004644 [Kwoniella shandongensis]KAA5527108.1 hypothetical protein CI109_004644 [Kwoniella shandongensis]
MTPKVALLGSGVFAQASYLPALLSLSKSSDLILHTIWSRSSSSATTLHSQAVESGISPAPALQNGPDGLEAVLNDPEIDAVLLVLPITAQPELVRKAWKAGKHVISEKPLGKDVAEARGLIEEYEKEYKPKGLIWRVAENFAHEPVLRFTRDKLANTPELGPMLNWKLNFEAYVEDGSKYQATEWRTVPAYQGGFLLDGGVHFSALLRTVLPDSALPSSLVSFSHLHRTHLLPHDTLTAISLPSPSSTTSPNGPKTKLSSAIHTEKDLASQPGQSAPLGQIFMSFALPDTAPETRTPNGLIITYLNGVAKIVSDPKTREWIFNIYPANGSSVEKVEKRGSPEGVEVEIKHFANAIQAIKDGKKDGGVENYGEPRGALWDLAVIEGMLKSEGKELNLDQLIKGE